MGGKRDTIGGRSVARKERAVDRVVAKFVQLHNLEKKGEEMVEFQPRQWFRVCLLHDFAIPQVKEERFLLVAYMHPYQVIGKSLDGIENKGIPFQNEERKCWDVQ